MERDTAIGGPRRRFPDTRLSVVGAARSEGAAERRAGYETLIAAYWKPVYTYIRVHWRTSNEDAKDRAQAFFASAIEKNYFRSYDPAKGSFRTFLRACLDRFLANANRSALRKARAEAAAAPAPAADWDDYFEREWLRGLFEQALAALRDDCRARGAPVRFRLFERYDLHEGDERRATYAELGAEFGISAAEVTNQLAAARRAFRKIVLEKLRETTGGERQFRDEARRVLGLEV